MSKENIIDLIYNLPGELLIKYGFLEGFGKFKPIAEIMKTEANKLSKEIIPILKNFNSETTTTDLTIIQNNLSDEMKELLQKFYENIKEKCKEVL